MADDGGDDVFEGLEIPGQDAVDAYYDAAPPPRMPVAAPSTSAAAAAAATAAAPTPAAAAAAAASPPAAAPPDASRFDPDTGLRLPPGAARPPTLPPQPPGAVAAATAATAAAAAAAVRAGTILASNAQRGNPALRWLRHVRVEFGPIVPDYMLGKGTAALYLSLRYHALHPTYLLKRLRELRADYRLRVIIVEVDVADSEKLMLEVCRTAVLSDCTVVCASTPAEAARYLETYKAYENKSAAAIRERVEDAYLPKVTEALTLVRCIHRTDILTLL